MARVLAIDFGRKRCGVAVSDPLKICANGLPTVLTPQLIPFLKDYCSREEVDTFVVGKPLDLQGNPSDSMRYINPFLSQLKKTFPNIPIVMVDERFTSTIAHREMIAAGLKKKTRQDKALADKTAAVLILTSFLSQ